MAFGDEIFKVVKLANGNSQHQHHGEAGVNGARHEVGRKNGGVPAGHDAHGKIKTDHGVNREHQRRG